MSTEEVPFKRLAIGDKFSSKEDMFRKIGSTLVIRLLPNGTGQTHNKIKFPRNRFVTPL